MKSCLTLLLLIVANMALSQSSEYTQPVSEDSAEVSDIFIGLSLNTTYRPDQPLLLSPAASLRKGHFYSSVRYNYEATKTVSVTAGYQFFAGDNTWFVATPMLGFSFGNYDAFNPELLLLFGTGNLILSADAQISFPFDEEMRKTALLWAGAFYSLNSWLYGGVTVQKNRLFSSGNNLDAGVLVGIMPGNFDISFQANRFWEPKGYYQLNISYFINPRKSDRKYAPAVPGNDGGNGGK